MKRTRIITLLVVLALALSVVTPALANGNSPARLPWRELAAILNWFYLGDVYWWGFFVCDVNTGQTYWTYFGSYPEDWREWPDWLKQEYIDIWNSLPPINLQFGPCRDGNGVNQTYP